MRVGGAEYTRNGVRGHFFDKVNCIVDKEIVDNFLKLGIGERVYQQLFHIGIHIGENLSRHILRQQSEKQRNIARIDFLIIVKALNEVGNIRLIQLREKLFYLFKIAVFDCFTNGFVHSFRPPFTK